MLSKIYLAILTVAAVVGSAQISLAKDPDLNAVDAAKHIGETATVTDKVEDAYQAKGGNIFLNMGGRHPNETFTVFVATANAEAFKDFKSYLNKTISVTGKIEDHKGKPEITVKTPSDITVKEDSGAAAPSASPAATASATP
jgi:DNA/RNA endonuclease YhcR with UshA esterase domain